MPNTPSWFTDGKVFVSYADTCGINKDGNTLFTVDPKTGKRTSEIDDGLRSDIEALIRGHSTDTSRWLPVREASLGAPRYYDRRHSDALHRMLDEPEYRSFTTKTLGSLIAEGYLIKRAGHGSPSADRRSGDIPYIKVSDVRAGQINVNPSNMVTRVVAQEYWKSTSSGLAPFDLITPIRASKNIGEFAVLMPGQEQVVLTKEMLVLRPTPKAQLDNFYLLWALSLKVVRDQWKRIVLMQTNREDVGSRYLEIEVPWTDSPDDAARVSASFRAYYLGLNKLRLEFAQDLAKDGRHHVFLGGAPVATEAGPTDRVKTDA